MATSALAHAPQHFLYFLPLLQGHGALRAVPGYFLVWEETMGWTGRTEGANGPLECSVDFLGRMFGNIS